MNTLANLHRTRPVAVLDIETTGLDTQTARIVELAISKFWPPETMWTWTPDEMFTWFFNPGVPIPADATKIHGITDTDVAEAVSFGHEAGRIAHILSDCDLAGFNLKKYDLPILCAEFTRANQPFSLAGRNIIDVLDIYRHYHQRNLEAAVKEYLGRVHESAHSAWADAAATAEVLAAMLDRHGDLPRDVQQLAEKFRGGAVDLAGFFVRAEDGVVRFGHGKHKGKSLHEVVRMHSDYITWLLRSDFAEDTKAIARAAMDEACGRGAAS